MKQIPEYVRRIPLQYQDHFGIKRFKISLNKCKNKKEVEELKVILKVETNKIFRNIGDYDKAKVMDDLKEMVEIYINGNNGILLKYEKIKKIQEEKKDVVSFQSIIKKEIDKKEIEHKTKLNQLKKDGIDITLKQTNATARQYKSILNYITEFFGKDFDISELNKNKAKEFRNFLITYERELKDGFKNIDNNTINLYIRQLKTILKNYILDNDLSVNNVFDNFKALKISSNKKMFNYTDIKELEEKMEGEEYLFFNTLLLTGMRFEELMTIKKKDLKNEIFSINDAKNQFERLIPIHKNIAKEINEKIKDLKEDDYIFFNVENRLAKRNILNKILKEESGKTLHKTRATFITYLNYFNENFSDKDILSLTHKLIGVDNKNYIVKRNSNNLKNIIDSIDLKKLNEIQG